MSTFFVNLIGAKISKNNNDIICSLQKHYGPPTMNLFAIVGPLKLKIFEFFEFPTVISIDICQLLTAKLRNLTLSKVATQAVIIAKNVPRFSFCLLVFQKL